MYKVFCLSFLLLFPLLTFAQNLPPQLEGKVSYPVLDFHTWSGVIKAEYSALKYDPDLAYKVLLDIAVGIKDSTKMDMGLVDAARTYNLLVANGVPKENLDVAIVVHGGLVSAVLNNDAYKAKFGVDNPNLVAIQQMYDAGIKFYICSQSMAMQKKTNEDLASAIEVALSAKTAIITLEQMGYAYLSITDD